jgi:hypothetical protein
MKRILTLALLATTALSVPALAEDSSSRAGLGLGVGADVGVGANVGGNSIGANVDSSADTSTRSETSSSDAQVDTSADADVNADANTDTSTGRTATGDTSIGGSAESSASAASSAAMDMRGENLARNDIILIQQALRQEGFYNGTADGIWGPRTASALMQFQQRQQLGATGQVNTNTLDKLGVELGSSTSGAASNNQTTIENSVGVGATANPGSAGTY